MKSKIFLVLAREFNIRVKKKSFILLTIITPLFFGSLVTLPSIIMQFTKDESVKNILVIDNSQIAEPFFKNSESMSFTFEPQSNIETLKKDFEKRNLYAIVEISQLDSNMNVAISAISSKQMNLDTKSEIQRIIQNAVESNKLKKYNIENLDDILKDVRTKINIKTYTISDEGKEKLGMVEIYMIIAYIASFMIYMFIFMFGSMVMRGVIEEKTTRIVEVIVSSIKPFQLMMGKILGVGAVAVLQFSIWILLSAGILFGVTSAMGIESISETQNMTAGMAATGSAQQAVEALQQNSSPLQEVMQAISGVNFTSIIVGFLMFFILGYLLYASMFSAVASAVDNEADTQQMILPVTLPLIIGLFIMIHTFQYPDSALSFWGSMIPFTSPMVMMARIPFGVPTWEIALSLGLLFITFLGITYISAKIYRIGILSYGKKATIKDMIKWIKYS